MRPLEIFILGLNLFSLTRLTLWVQRWPRWSNGAPLLALALVGLHLVIEKYRWQMLPAYIFSLGLSIVILTLDLSLPKKPSTRWRPWVVGGAGWGALIVTAILPYLFPVPQFPPLTGQYPVGTISYHLIDSTRAEIYTAEPNDHRELMIQVWYPAAPAPDATTGAWMERMEIVAPAITSYLRLPPFLLDHLNLVHARSYPAALMVAAPQRFPVIVHSHGWNGFRTLETNQVEELASQGYIVIAIDHTYGSMVTVFEDGRVALNNPQALPRGVPTAEYQQASETLESVYAADIRYVFDRLPDFDQGTLGDQRFAGRLDLAHIGVYGHSTGGGATVIACAQDARCKAGLGMDAWVEPVPEAVITAGLDQPFLFMRSEAWSTGKNEDRLARLYANLHGDGYRLSILGTKHYDFTDLPLLSPLTPVMGLKGPLDGDRVIEIVNVYLRAFFDQYLKGESEALLKEPSAEYAEVSFERR